MATTHQTDVSYAPLCGRDDESLILLQAYQRSCASSVSQELVLIQGLSGTGKTALANSIVDQVIDDDVGFFLSGKCGLGRIQKPYDVFVSAFERFPESVHDLDKSSHKDHHSQLSDMIRREICEAVGNEGKLLTGIMPTLGELIGQQDEPCKVQGTEALQRFQFVFSKFVRAISSVVPLVLFLDDLQWCDPASLSLLQVVLESRPEVDQSSSLLVICTIRDEGLTTDDIQLQTPSEQTSIAQLTRPSHFEDFLSIISSTKSINVTKIELHNLDMESTSRLVDEYLDMSPELSKTLGPIVHARSGGNPFHAVQLLRQLVNHRQMSKQGSFNDVNIFEIAEAVDTVEKLLLQRLLLLHPSVQEFLQTAACMGDCIDHPAICTVFQGDVISVDQFLKTSVNEGFLDYEPGLGQFRFTHDRFRHVVLSTIDDMCTKSFEIGYKLWTMATPMLLQSKMFLVVNLLNQGTNLINDQSERYKAAAINLEAGLKAISLTAFQDASRFLQSGIDFLKSGDYWNDQYQLSLDLFDTAADAELCNQNFDRVSELVTETLARARKTRDKLRAYITLINSMGQRGNMESATQVGVDVLRQLGESLPRKVTNTTILVEIVKTRIAIRGRPNSSLLTLPPMQNEDRIAAIYVMTNLLPYTYQAASNYVVVLGARIVRLCLKYGMHKCCALGFAMFGFAMCSLDRKEGYRLGKLALTITDRYRARELLPRVHMTFYALVHHWSQPLVGSLKPMEDACKVGFDTGDVESALTCLSCCVSYYVCQGKPLGPVEDMSNELIQWIRRYRQDGSLGVAQAWLQFIHNVTGRAPVPTVLAGEASPLYDTSWRVDSLLVSYLHYGLGAEVAFLFGDLDLAGQLLEKKRSLGFEPVALYYCSKICFQEALICAGLARRTTNNITSKQRMKFRHTVKCALKQLRAWAKDCPQNYLHKQQLVEAELKSLRSVGPKCRHAIKELYDLAISGAIKEGFLHEAAQACELAGDFMRCHNNMASALSYWQKANQWYLEWGATEKAKQLSTHMLGEASSDRLLGV